jgi:ferrous iron transport protein B
MAEITRRIPGTVASVAVIGNPNCGKTTLFNGLTGHSAHIGNWAGVTVEERRGTLLGNDSVEVVDLPGIYSLHAVSEDEIVARNHVISGDFDLMVNIIDSSNLERNLFLTLTLLELRRPMLVVLNMMDIAAKRGLKIDAESFSKILGVPVLDINALYGADVRNVRRAIIDSLEEPAVPKAGVDYPGIVETVVSDWTAKLGEHSRPTALMLLEEDDETTERIITEGSLTQEDVEHGLKSIESQCGETPDVVIADAKLNFISELVKSCSSSNQSGVSRSDRIDRIVLHNWFGIPVFLGVIYLLFWTVMNIGGAFITFFDILFGAVFVDGAGHLLARIGTPEWIVVLLADGVGGGIQTVATFIPIIFTMFFMLSLLEDSGYMARASFVMNRFMRRIGLPGKAFVPMLVGFGCTVPAVMATRTLENKKDRSLTVFLTPFMSCGARLPVYALFGAAFFRRHAGLVVVSLYLTGILLAIVTAFLLKNTLFKGEAAHFAMELPPYHAPRMGEIMKRTRIRLQDFVVRAGRIIVFAVLLLSFLNSLGTDGSFGNEDGEKSILASIGRTITPILTPMGVDEDNWPATVGLITGIFAKEAIVGTMNSLYGQIAAGGSNLNPESDETYDLGSAALEAVLSIPEAFKGVLGTLIDPLGANIVTEDTNTIAVEIGAETSTFTALKESFGNDWRRAYAYLLFVLVYFPCLAAMGAIVREIGPKYGILAVVYLTILAWSIATLFFQISTGGSVYWIIFAVVLVAVFIPIFNLVSGRWSSDQNAA